MNAIVRSLGTVIPIALRCEVRDCGCCKMLISVAASPIMGARVLARAAPSLPLPHERDALAYIEPLMFALKAVRAAAFVRKGFRYLQESAGCVRQAGSLPVDQPQFPVQP